MKLKLGSVSATRSLIKKLNGHDLENCDYLTIREDVRNLISDCPMVFTDICEGTNFVRARRSNKKLERVADIGCPKDELVNSFQRCNPPGVSRFYASLDVNTAVREIGAEVGDIVYVGNFELQNKLITAWMPPDLGEEITDPRLPILASFIETKFSQPVHEVYSNQYKITAAFFDELTEFKPSFLDDSDALNGRKELSEGIHSLVYPSVANSSKSSCIAFKSEFAKKKLRFNFIEEIRIGGFEDNRVLYHRLDAGARQGGDKIVWGLCGKAVTSWV